MRTAWSALTSHMVEILPLSRTKRSAADLLAEDSMGSPKKPQVSPLRCPGFPVDVGGVGKHHAPFFKERRTRGLVQRRVAEIRVRSGRDDNFV